MNNNKILASVIIGLCALSIIVGIFNTAISSKNPKQYRNKAEESSSSFRNIFYGGDKIALVSLQGPITSEESSDFFKKANSATSVKKALIRAYEDNSVKGILLKINSPGGTVGMSQEIYSTLMRVRNKKPVVVSMSDVTASGGYYIACAADRIFANPGTLTGSIGVIMNSFNAQELMNEKLGIKSNIIKSGKFKDIASPYRPMTQDERQLLQNIISSTHEQFVNAIIDGRVKRKDNYKVKKVNLTVEQLKKYSDGRIFTGKSAKQMGFVDHIGGTYEAQKAINKMIKTKYNTLFDLPLVPYNVPSGLGELLYGVSESIMPNKDIVSSRIPLSAKYPHQPLFAWE